MSSRRFRSLLALLVTIGALFAVSGAFAWVEKARGGKQVYPEGYLSSFTLNCSVASAAFLAFAAVLALRRKTLPQDAEPPELDGHLPGAPPSSAALVALAGTAILFTGMAVQTSYTMGRLALPPSYDDVGYFLDAINRLNTFQDGGIPALIKQYRDAPPHGPASSFLAALGYVFLGTADWVPPLMNVLIVFALLLFVWGKTRSLGLLESATVYLFTLSWPLTYHLVVTCIPDFSWSISLAMAGYLALERPFAARSKLWQYGIGLIFGLSFLAKPTSFMITGFMLVIAFFLIVVVDFAGAGPPGIVRRLRAPLFRLAIACSVVCLPHYYVSLRGILSYIETNALGPRQDLWKYPGTPWQQLAFYVNGDGGLYHIGTMMLSVWAVLIVAGLVWLLAVRRRNVIIQSSVIAAFFLFGLIAVGITSYKNIHLGLFVPSMFLLTGVSLMAGLFTAAKTTTSTLAAFALRGICVFVGVTSALSFQPQPMKSLLVHAMADYQTTGVEFQREAQWRRATIARVIQRLEMDSRRKLTLGITRAGLYGNPSVFQLQFNKNRTKVVDCVDAGSFGSDNLKFESELASVDYLYFRSSGLAEEKSLLDFMTTQGKWRLVERFDDPTGAGVMLLSKVPDWTSVSLTTKNVSGFSAAEGPYAPDKFQMRWGHGPKSVVPFSTELAAKLEFQLEGSTSVHEQRIRILLDGTEIGTQQILAGAGFQAMNTAFEVAAGQHIIEIDYANWEKSEGRRPLAVLFRKMNLVKK
jgi:hypothetical protein